MINISKNRDLTGVEKFWKDELRNYLFENKKGSSRPYISYNDRRVCFDTRFLKYRKILNDECEYLQLTYVEKSRVMCAFDDFKLNYNAYVVNIEEIKELIDSKLFTPNEVGALGKVFIPMYNGFISEFGEDVMAMLNVRTCPYCNRAYTFTVKKEGGAFTTRPEFDHFYNKSEYPLLALTFYNLVPSCHTCNLGKLTNKVAVNPYFRGFDAKFSICDKNGNPMNANGIFRIREVDDFTVGFRGTSDDDKENIRKFGLDKLYNQHKDFVIELILKAASYNEIARQGLVDSFHGLFHNPNDVFEFVWGANLTDAKLENRVLSKLTRDILEQLGIIDDNT